MLLDVLWHMRGSIDLSRTATDDVILRRVVAALERQRKPISDRGATFVEFDSPLFSDFFAPNWLALIIYDRGRIWIDRTGVVPVLRYDLRSLHGFIFCGVSALAVAVIAEPAIGLGAFAWLYGMNIVLAVIRVPGVFERAASGH